MMKHSENSHNFQKIPCKLQKNSHNFQIKTHMAFKIKKGRHMKKRRQILDQQTGGHGLRPPDLHTTTEQDY